MRLLAVGIFFVSGFAALVYQVIWQRLLAIFSGADVYSATIVVAVFMTGLGCGSLAGGMLADRLSRIANVALFAAAELGIALFGFASRVVLYDWLYGRFGDLAAQPALTAAVLFVTLLWPTFLMGVSLPLLARAMTWSIEAAASTTGWLYACNTLGAALGALCAIWSLVPRYGLEGGLAFAATLNLTCAALALLVIAGLFLTGSSTGSSHAVSGRMRDELPKETPSAIPFGYSSWLGLYVLSGFLALSLEIVWFRLLGVMLKSTALTFGTLLAQYLFWLATGSALGSLVAKYVKRPALAFLAVQTMAAVYAGLGLSLVLGHVGRSASLSWLRDYFAGYEPIHPEATASAIRTFLNGLIGGTPSIDALPGDFLWLYFALPALFIGPATLLMGLAFPLVQRVVQTDLAVVGRRVGNVLLANIAGSTAGTILTGSLFLTWLGTPGTLRLLVALSSVFALCAMRLIFSSRRNRRLGYATVGVLTIVVVATMPPATPLWAQLHGTSGTEVAFAEDASGLAVLKNRGGRREDGIHVYINGLGQSEIPYGNTIQTLLGAMPAMIHPNPREAAVVGLGSGNTLASLAGRKELQRITSIEIVAPLLGLLRSSTSRIGYSGMTAMLDDPRIEHVAGDGRLFIRQSNRKFDIIEADALRPVSAYSGNLYSMEYFELLRAHLQPSGLAVSWAPTERVERTFTAVFPHVAQYGPVFIGSNEPVVIDRDAISKRLAHPDTQRYYARLGLDIRTLLERFIWSPVMRHREDHAADAVNSDLFPRDEFNFPAVFDLPMVRRQGLR